MGDVFCDGSVCDVGRVFDNGGWRIFWKEAYAKKGGIWWERKRRDDRRGKVTINKKHLFYAGLGIVVLVFFCLLMRSCKLTDRLSVTTGELNVVRANNEMLAKEALKERAALTEKIEYETKKVVLLSDELKRKDAKIDNLTKRTKDLEATYPTLPDDTAKIQNLTAQVIAWKEQFNLSDAKCRDYEGIVFALTNKYELQVTISDTWKSQFEGEVKAGALKDDAITLLKRDLRVARLFGTVKTTAVLALGGFVIYNLIKK